MLSTVGRSPPTPRGHPPLQGLLQEPVYTPALSDDMQQPH